MESYEDALRFLAEHEVKSDAELNQRIALDATEINEIRIEFPGIPEDYLDYLTEVGWGDFRESQYMVYSGLVNPDDIFDPVAVSKLTKKVLCFGDNFSGNVGGFLPEEHWKVIEILHEDMTIFETGKSFGDFIRRKMLMDENGKDTRRY